MNPLLLLWGARLVGALVLSGSLWAGYESWVAHERGIGDTRTTARYEKALKAQKAEAATVLSTAIEQVRMAQIALNEIHDQQELQDADHQKTVAALNTRLHSLAGPAGRLRDPNQTGCGAGSGGAQSAAAAPATDRPADTPEAGGLLSTELSGLLTQLTQEADGINLAYISCRADALNIRSSQTTPPLVR